MVGGMLAWLEGVRWFWLRLMETSMLWGWQAIVLEHCTSGWLMSAASDQTGLAPRAGSRSPQLMISINSV